MEVIQKNEAFRRIDGKMKFLMSKFLFGKMAYYIPENGRID